MKYDAFISYRHSELDMYVAKKVHSGLENYRLPPSVRKMSGRKKIKRVFRDQEELPIGSDLGDNISKALEASEYLIVICSPRTKDSYWVLKEIESFIKMHDRQHVLAVLIEGEPCDSFPELLLTDDEGNPVEPLAADVRGESRKEVNKKLKSELTRLAAALIGCNYDDLRQRRRERRIRNIAVIVTAIAVVVAALAAGFAVYNAKMAAAIEKNYNLAVENYNVAMENLKKSQINESRYISETAGNLFEDGDRETAAVLALEALGTDESNNSRPYVPQAEYALSRILYTYDTAGKLDKDGLLTHELPVKDMKYCSGGKYLLSQDQGGNIYAWDAENSSCTLKLPVNVDEDGKILEPIQFDGDEEHLYICTNAGIKAYNYSGEEQWDYAADTLRRCVMDVENSLAFLEFDGVIEVINLSDGSLVGKTELDEGLIFSKNLDYCKATNSFTVCAYTSASNTDKNTYLINYDLDTFEMKQVTVPVSDVAELVCTEEGYIGIIGYEYDDIYVKNLSDFDSYLICFDPDLKQLYSKTFPTTSGEFATSYYILKVREYENEDMGGEKLHEFVYAMGRYAYECDIYTGKDFSKIAVANYIKSVKMSAVSDTLYLAQEDGTIDIADGLSEKVYSDNAIKTDVNLMDMTAYNGIMMVRKYGGTDILVLKCHEGRDMKEIYSVEGYMYGATTSPNGDCVAINVNNGDEFSVLLVDKDGNKLGEINKEAVNGLYHENEQFIADGRYLVTNSDHEIYLFDPLTMKADVIKPAEESNIFLSYVYVTRNGEYMIMYSRVGAALIDLTKNEVISSFSFEDNEGGTSIVSEDGKYIYLLTADNALTTIDTATGLATTSDIEELRIAEDMILKTNMISSADGSHLAICCADNKVRLYNTKTKAIDYSFDMCGHIRQYMYFTKDNTKFLYQGDDYYLHIVDLETGNMVYAAENQWNIVEETSEDDERGIIVLSNANGVMAIEREGFIPVAFADRGGSYNTATNELYQIEYRSLYSFPFQTIDSLKEDARKQFPEMELSDEIRLKFNL